MSRKKLLWQIYPYYLIIIIGALVSAAWYASKEMKDVYRSEISKRLEAVARLTVNQLQVNLTVENLSEIDRVCKASGQKTQTRITMINSAGRVLGDSDAEPHEMENHKDRPELVEAMAGRVAVVTRFSNTLQKNMIYVAVPVEKEGQIVGAVRSGVPVTTISSVINVYNRRIIWSGLIITILATIISLVIFRKLKRPLSDLKDGAERFARGEFEVKIAVPDSEEIGALAESMNQMAQQLDERISATVQQRNEQEALFSSMIEGVLAVDADENIININRAAARLFGIDPFYAIKKSVYEVIRHAEFLDFVISTLSSPATVEQEITIQAEPEKVLQAHGSVMINSEGKRVGAVIVLNDVTDLKKLENIRRDFVANVSHELKTPITSIKGFVETLIDGAIDNKEESLRFLNIIIKQTDRLNSIVDDLLTLSRIEKEYERAEIELKPDKLWDILVSAEQACELSAKSKQISIDLNGDKSLVANVNRRQLEQALINLIDNAVKYSGANSRIEVGAISDNGEIKISVRDFGRGIDKKHLPRIFERFYRVDKARSREVGGTGLGLSIVKHIAIAHKGNVTVESTPGKGSTFTIHLPAYKR